MAVFIAEILLLAVLYCILPCLKMRKTDWWFYGLPVLRHWNTWQNTRSWRAMGQMFYYDFVWMFVLISVLFWSNQIIPYIILGICIGLWATAVMPDAMRPKEQ